MVEGIKEGTGCKIDVSLYDESDILIDPQSLAYQVMDKLTNTIHQSGVIGDGSVTSNSNNTVTIAVSGINNVIVDQKHPYERKVAIVEADGLVVDTVEYNVINIRTRART
jgi:hypothetical protein